MLTVSNYHYIREDFTAPYPSIFGVTPVAFERQLLMLGEIGTFIHPQDLINNTEAILSSEQHFLLVTFDDGLKEQFDLAKPILDRLGIPALFFANSINYMEKKVTPVHKIHLLRSQIAPSVLLRTFADGAEFGIGLTAEEQMKAEIHYNYDDKESAHLKYVLNFKLSAAELSAFTDGLFSQYFKEEEILDDLYMTAEQLGNLAKQGMLGSHTHSHIALGLTTPERIKEELEVSKIFLEELTQSNIRSVSYPFGSEESCAPPVTTLAKAAGYTIGFSMERGSNTAGQNALLLKRFDCNDLPGGKNEQKK